jgi:hypothetical protein
MTKEMKYHYTKGLRAGWLVELADGKAVVEYKVQPLFTFRCRSSHKDVLERLDYSVRLENAMRIRNYTDHQHYY